MKVPLDDTVNTPSLPSEYELPEVVGRSAWKHELPKKPKPEHGGAGDGEGGGAGNGERMRCAPQVKLRGLLRPIPA